MEWLKRLIKTKTFWASLGGILVVIGTLVVGEQSLSVGLGEIFAFIVAMFFRDAIAKVN